MGKKRIPRGTLLVLTVTFSIEVQEIISSSSKFIKRTKKEKKVNGHSHHFLSITDDKKEYVFSTEYRYDQMI